MHHLELLTEKELAARLKCSVAALRLWRKRGLPCRQLGLAWSALNMTES